SREPGHSSLRWRPGSFLGLCFGFGRSLAFRGSFALGRDHGLRGRAFLFDLELALVHDFDDQLFGVHQEAHALRHREVRDSELHLDLFEERDVDLERRGDVRRQTLHADRVQRLEDIGVSALDGCRLAGQADRDLDLDLLLQVDLVEVDVDRSQLPRMGLDLADKHLLGAAAVEHEVDQVRAARLDKDFLKLEPVECDRGRLGVVAVDDGRQLTLAQHAARAFAERLAGRGFELHGSASGGEAHLSYANLGEPNSSPLRGEVPGVAEGWGDLMAERSPQARATGCCPHRCWRARVYESSAGSSTWSSWALSTARPKG